MKLHPSAPPLGADVWSSELALATDGERGASVDLGNQRVGVGLGVGLDGADARPGELGRILQVVGEDVCRGEMEAPRASNLSSTACGAICELRTDAGSPASTWAPVTACPVVHWQKDCCPSALACEQLSGDRSVQE